MSCLFLFELITQNKIDINKYVGGGVMLVLLIINYFRYIRKDYFEILKKKWINESSKQRNDTFIWIYIILSVVGCFGLAIYLGSTK